MKWLGKYFLLTVLMVIALPRFAAAKPEAENSPRREIFAVYPSANHGVYVVSYWTLSNLVIVERFNTRGEKSRGFNEGQSRVFRRKLKSGSLKAIAATVTPLGQPVLALQDDSNEVVLIGINHDGSNLGIGQYPGDHRYPVVNLSKINLPVPAENLHLRRVVSDERGRILLIFTNFAYNSALDQDEYWLTVVRVKQGFVDRNGFGGSDGVVTKAIPRNLAKDSNTLWVSINDHYDINIAGFFYSQGDSNDLDGNFWSVWLRENGQMHDQHSFRADLFSAPIYYAGESRALYYLRKVNIADGDEHVAGRYVLTKHADPGGGISAFQKVDLGSVDYGLEPAITQMPNSQIVIWTTYGSSKENLTFEVFDLRNWVTVLNGNIEINRWSQTCAGMFGSLF